VWQKPSTTFAPKVVLGFCFPYLKSALSEELSCLIVVKVVLGENVIL